MDSGEQKLDRLERDIERLHRGQDEDYFSPIVVAVKEDRMLESFRFGLLWYLISIEATFPEVNI